MRIPATALVLALLLLASDVLCAATLAGRPAIERFSPDIEVYPGAFAVAQDAAGIVYVGGADGLLSFDGSHWNLHAFESAELVRSLALDDDGRLYVGGYNGFGFVETPVAPDAAIVELSSAVDSADADFADVWYVLAAPEGVFFVALNHLFVYDRDTETLRTFRHAGRFGAIARIDGRVVVQYRGEGLREFDGEAFQPIAGTEELAGQIFQFVPLAAGGAITLARDGRWMYFNERGIDPFPVPSSLPPSSEFNHAVRAPDGRIAMGARDGRVWFLDPPRGVAESVRVTTDWIAGLTSSREGGLIVQSDHETLHLRWPSNLTALGPEDGLTGSIYEMIEWQGRWYAVGSSGVLARSRPGAPFELLDWTDFEAWDLEPLGDGTALLSESYVLKHVDVDGVIESFAAIQYPRTVLASRFDEGLYYVGTEFGVATIRRTGGAWEMLKGVDEEASGAFTLAEVGPGELLIGSELAGVRRLVFDDRRAAVVEQEGFDDTLTYADWTSSEVVRIDGVVHAVTMAGVWAWRDGAFEPATLSGFDALRREDAFLSLTKGPDGMLWAWDFKRLHRRGLSGIWLPVDPAPLLRGAMTSVSFAPDGRLLVGMIGGLLIHDPDAPEVPGTGLEAMMRSVEYRSADPPERRRLSLDSEAPPSLSPQGGYSLRFEYVLPGLESRSEVEYQARMRGFEEAFSPWEPIDNFTYYDLKPGRYAFEVRARDGQGRVTMIDPFEFEIAPPWHQSGWVQVARWAAFGLVLMLLVWGFMRARVWRLEVERQRLSDMVDERTEALEAANRQLKTIAEVDDLTGAANRRRLDAVLRRDLEECRRRHRTMAVALIDLDRFKPFNDEYGHLAGDRALRRVAETLRGVFNEADQLVARFGGDEFVVVLPGVDRTRATELARNARSALDRCGLDLKFSIGIAVAGIGVEVDPDSLIDAADRQMYVAKKAGRDGVSVTLLDGTET